MHNKFWAAVKKYRRLSPPKPDEHYWPMKADPDSSYEFGRDQAAIADNDFDDASKTFAYKRGERDFAAFKAGWDAMRGVPLARDVHFVGFKGEEYWSAVKIFGVPNYIHRQNDVRLWLGGELAPGDIVVMANGCENRVYLQSFNDSDRM